MVAAKSYLRNVLATCRNNLSPSYVDERSTLIQRRLVESRWYRQAAIVVLYAPKDNEVETRQIFADAIASRRVVLFPKVIRSSKQLALVRVDDLTDLQSGAFGVLEPMGTETVPPAHLRQALICVPGLAFSPSGHRLGRGGGFYDRLIGEVGSDATSAGLAYSFQVLDQIPQSPVDRRLNLIFTESALYEAASNSEPARTWADQGGI